MNMQTALQLGEKIAAQIQANQFDAAYAQLAPVLAERTPFRYSERIGEVFGAVPLAACNQFLAKIAAHRTEGGWVVIGGALRAQLNRDLPGAFGRARTYIIAADVWYGADILGERIPGPALVNHFDGARNILSGWQDDPNRWVRRAVGVGVHFWAKRSRGDANLIPQASALLDLLEPMFGEWEMDAVKGIGWGLKTLGRYYPELIAEWLPRQTGRKHRAIMRQKASKFLGD